MKKALLLTDGSVDMALSLNRWLATQLEPVDLTVVYAYALTQPTDQPLKAAVHREARQVASEALNHWLNMLSVSVPGRLNTEILLGDPELVLTIHLLLRRYDYLLVDGCQPAVSSMFRACQAQTHTQLCTLNEELSEPFISVQENESDFSFVQASRQLAT